MSQRRSIARSGAALVSMLVLLTACRGSSRAAARALERGDWSEAARELEPLARRGDRSAQTALGAMDFSGEGVPQARALAAEWCERAATQGEARARCSHSVMYEAGDGVPHNDERAVAWRQRAWEQDHPGALDNLGPMFIEGRGVERDEARGFALLNRAAGRVWWKRVARWD